MTNKPYWRSVMMGYTGFLTVVNLVLTVAYLLPIKSNALAAGLDTTAWALGVHVVKPFITPMVSNAALVQLIATVVLIPAYLVIGAVLGFILSKLKNRNKTI